MTTLRIWVLLLRRRDGAARWPDALAAAGFAVVTTALAVAVAGLLAFWRRSWSSPDLGGLYQLLATTACALMIVPILTLGGIAARLTAGSRNHRLAVLRLLGATTARARVVTILETTTTALVGGVVGIGGYAALLPVLSQLPFDGRRFGPGELWLGPAGLLGVLGGVAIAAIASSVVSMTGLSISPLGVVSRHSPRRLSVWRLLLAVVLLLGWPMAMQLLPTLGAIAFVVGTVVMITVVGPYLIMVLGRLVARGARRPTVLLAARRIVDDPRQAWRTCSTVSVVVVLATLSSVAGAMAAMPNDGAPHLPADLATGSLLTMIIVAVLGATASAVVLAAAAVESAPTHRRLHIAGMPTSDLHASRGWEVGIPLIAALALAGAFAAMIIAPFSTMLGPEVLLRFGLAVAGVVLVSIGSVAVSRPLVTRAVRGVADHL